MLNGKKILLGITGSIAAYKSVYLVRHLVKAGASKGYHNAFCKKDFVSPLTLSTLSKNPVLVDLFDEQSWSKPCHAGPLGRPDAHRPPQLQYPGQNGARAL